MYPSQNEFLLHILDECNYLLYESHQSTFEEFADDPRLSRAICRSLEIIGEASAKIPPSLKLKYNLVSWREISDLRNRIIHHYFGIDYDIVKSTILTDIPELKDWIVLILEKEQ
jgi:uncharacterized protein with HEPN domain